MGLFFQRTEVKNLQYENKQPLKVAGRNRSSLCGIFKRESVCNGFHGQLGLFGGVSKLGRTRISQRYSHGLMELREDFSLESRREVYKKSDGTKTGTVF